MNRLTRTLVASVLVTVMGLGTALGVLAKSTPSEETHTDVVWWNTGTRTTSATANGAEFVEVPENTVADLYTATITVTIQGGDPSA